MARRILAWECRHCGSIKKSEYICQRHEKACLSNPDARNCILCVHSRSINIGDGIIDKSMQLVCRQTDRICSTAVSANCPYFVRK